MDEFEQRGIMISETITGLHSAVNDAFSLVFEDPETERLGRVRFTREEAERIAVWLRVRLDKPVADSRRPGGFDVAPARTVRLVDEYGRRPEPWTVRVNVNDVPANLRSPGALQQWFAENCRSFRLSGDERGVELVFHECVGLPGDMPRWARCELATEGFASHSPPRTFLVDAASRETAPPLSTPDLVGPARDGIWDLSFNAMTVPADLRSTPEVVDFVKRAGIAYASCNLERHSSELFFHRCINVPERLPSWIRAEKVRG